jgi:hypothetical protein
VSRRLRPLAAAMGVALVAMALVASPLVSGASGADSCRWTLHSKRVVKHKRVVRHGKKRTIKVKKLKKWWSCDPVADPPIEATPSNRLLVRALDGGPSGTPFHFQLSRGDVSAGDVTVQLNNRSGDGHDLHIRPADSLLPEYSIPELSPGNPPQGTLAEGTFNLTPGSWYMWCDLLDHEQWMHASLTVN